MSGLIHRAAPKAPDMERWSGRARTGLVDSGSGYARAELNRYSLYMFRMCLNSYLI